MVPLVLCFRWLCACADCARAGTVSSQLGTGFPFSKALRSHRCRSAGTVPVPNEPLLEGPA